MASELRGNETASLGDPTLLAESAEELYEHAPVGYLSTLPGGLVVWVNETLLGWTGHSRDDLVGRKRLHDLLAPGARIYYETHYAPLLELQGSVREIAVELVGADGRRVPVLLESTLVRDDAGVPQVVRTMMRSAMLRIVNVCGSTSPLSSSSHVHGAEIGAPALARTAYAAANVAL